MYWCMVYGVWCASGDQPLCRIVWEGLSGDIVQPSLLPILVLNACPTWFSTVLSQLLSFAGQPILSALAATLGPKTVDRVCHTPTATPMTMWWQYH
jgi:hypothetical protein